MSGADERLATLGQIAITVSDIDAATLFYKDALGLPLMFEADNMAFFDLGPIRLMLAGEENGGGTKAGASAVLYYMVKDIDKMHKALTARGVSFVRDPFVAHQNDTIQLWMGFFRDMDQNLLAIMEEKKLTP